MGLKAALLDLALAIAATAVALAVRWALNAVLGSSAPLMLFVLAVQAAAYWGGLWPGLWATALSAVVGNWFFLEPIATTTHRYAADVVRIVCFLIVGCAVSVLCDRLRRARHMADDRRLDLEREIAERQRAQSRFLAAQESSLMAFTILQAVRDHSGHIVDFTWTYVNPAAALIAHTTPEALIGQRLLTHLPGCKSTSSLFDRYVRVVETGEPHNIQLFYDTDGIRGWFHNMAVRLDDGLAVSYLDVSETKRLEHDLRHTVDELAQADRRKDEFLATLAHELRSPLAPIRTSVALLRQSPADPAHTAYARDVIDRQVRHMARLLDDLLDVSRITRGRLDLRRERVPLHSILDSAVETSRPLIEAQRHHLTVTPPDPDGPPVWVEGDPVRLSQIFANLLNNAAKYTEPAGSIHLTASRIDDDASVEVRIRDTGIGLAPEHLPHVFDMYSQADSALDRAQGGLGIGLALVRGLVTMHGGTITAASDGPGQGSTFTVRLPIAAPPATPPPAPDDPPPAPAREARVLIVDDTRDSADSLALYLQALGHHARAVYRGADALDAVHSWTPDLVLLDITMPEMSGYEVAKRLRQSPNGQPPPRLVAMTGWGQDSDRKRTADAGFQHHLVKPVDPADILQLIADLQIPPT
jgi:two-component system CheB/CheR fusion protein